MACIPAPWSEKDQGHQTLVSSTYPPCWQGLKTIIINTRSAWFDGSLMLTPRKYGTPALVAVFWEHHRKFLKPVAMHFKKSRQWSNFSGRIFTPPAGNFKEPRCWWEPFVTGKQGVSRPAMPCTTFGPDIYLTKEWKSPAVTCKSSEG